MTLIYAVSESVK